MPRDPAGAPGVRASTRWMILAARSCSPQVMKILVPLIRNLPASVALGDRCGTGAQRADIGAGLRLGQVHRARPFARDQFGQDTWLSTRRCRDGRSPRSRRRSASAAAQSPCSTAPSVSSTHVARVNGRPWPPWLTGPRNAVPALFDERRVSRAKSVGQVTPRHCAQRAPCVSPLRDSGCPFAAGKLADAFGDCGDEVGRCVGESGRARRFRRCPALTCMARTWSAVGAVNGIGWVFLGKPRKPLAHRAQF